MPWTVEMSWIVKTRIGTIWVSHVLLITHEAGPRASPRQHKPRYLGTLPVQLSRNIPYWHRAWPACFPPRSHTDRMWCVIGPETPEILRYYMVRHGKPACPSHSHPQFV